jgi:hypothetical protein
MTARTKRYVKPTETFQRGDVSPRMRRRFFSGRDRIHIVRANFFLSQPLPPPHRLTPASQLRRHRAAFAEPRPLVFRSAPSPRLALWSSGLHLRLASPSGLPVCPFAEHRAAFASPRLASPSGLPVRPFAEHRAAAAHRPLVFWSAPSPSARLLHGAEVQCISRVPRRKDTGVILEAHRSPTSR